MSKLIKQKKLEKTPCLLVAENEESYKAGNINISPLHLEELLKTHEEMKQHPKINISELSE